MNDIFPIAVTQKNVIEHKEHQLDNAILIRQMRTDMNLLKPMDSWTNREADKYIQWLLRATGTSGIMLAGFAAKPISVKQMAMIKAKIFHQYGSFDINREVTGYMLDHYRKSDLSKLESNEAHLLIQALERKKISGALH